jgi:hypothetical protein
MGRLSKAKEAHVKNLLEAKAKQSTSVEDVTLTEDMTQNATDDLHEQGFFILEDNKGSDTDEGESDDEEETGDVLADADISMFSQILYKAQLTAVKAEREAAQEWPTRKRCYTGNALRTKCYHAQKRRKLAKTGQQFIQFFLYEEM